MSGQAQVAFDVVIPARHGSSRLPGKPLLDIAGRPLIVHVLERARRSGADRVLVATDDERIAAAVRAAGGEAMLTARTHASGTDRVAEVVRRLELDPTRVVVNLQGDEPCMPPAVVRQVARLLGEAPGADMATVCEPIADAAELADPNVVKVVCNAAGEALYFSRAPVPWPRERPGEPVAGVHFRHIGLYAFRAGFLRRFVAWPPAALERLEQLEQLRALAHGARVRVAPAVEPVGVGVDTPRDLERVRRMAAPPGLSARGRRCDPC